MNWYAGNIVEAVNLAKTRNAIFVVYVEGTDDLSTKLTSIINEGAVRAKLESNVFVAIKIQSESEAYVQFAQIYKLVPIPSIFFIGTNGTPIDIVTGVVASSQELSEKLENIVDRAGIKSQPNVTVVESNEAGPSTVLPLSSNSTPAEEEVVCEGDVCRKVPKTSENPKISENPANTEEKLLQDKMKVAKELLEKKKKDKENEEAKRLREQETQRRQLGRDLQSFKERQHEMDLLQLKEERKKDKIADQEARKRILDDIAQDRAERAARKNLDASSSLIQSESTKNFVRPKVNADFTRIQFKKPDGESEMHTFNSFDKFQSLRSYVADSVLQGSMKDFILATTFPRKEYSSEDDNKTMSELDLIPSAVILILPGDKSRSPLPISVSNIKPLGVVNSLFWGAFTQILSIFNYVKRLIWRQGDDTIQTGAQKRASEETLSANDSAKRRNLRHPLDNQIPPTSRPSSGVPYRRNEGSNIHRLHDTKDSDDENNTWNGNSTQQQ